MKSIKEKQLLVKWSRAMNEPVDRALAEEVDRYNQLQQEIKESIRNNTINDLFDASKVAVDIIKKVNIEYPKPPTFEELLNIVNDESNELATLQVPETFLPESPVIKTVEPTDLISRAAKHIHKEVKLEENSYQQPQPSPVEKNFNAVQKKLKFLEQAIGKIAAHGPGSGSYFLHDLGDTNYEIVKHPSNNDLLAYNAANAKWEVATVESLTSLHTASYFSSVNQTVNVDTQNYVTFNNVDFQNGFSNDGANIISSSSGIYNLEFSLQIHYLGGGGAGNHFELWLEKNGVNQANTNTAIHVSSNNPYNVAAWNFLVNLNANDKVALKWGVTNSQITLEAGGQLIGPSIPSAIITITTG